MKSWHSLNFRIWFVCLPFVLMRAALELITHAFPAPSASVPKNFLWRQKCSAFPAIKSLKNVYWFEFRWKWKDHAVSALYLVSSRLWGVAVVISLQHESLSGKMQTAGCSMSRSVDCVSNQTWKFPKPCFSGGLIHSLSCLCHYRRSQTWIYHSLGHVLLETWGVAIFVTATCRLIHHLSVTWTLLYWFNDF